MRNSAVLFAAAAAALLVGTAAPWLAWREARQQAYDIESGLALNYARDVLHRADETAAQAAAAIGRLESSGHPPCAPETVALMREIDVTSSYVQAVGHVAGNLIDCSSIGGAPVDIGTRAFRTSRGVLLYGAIHVGNARNTALLGIRRGDFIALVHRDLPLDIWTPVPDVALGVVHLEHRVVNMSRGAIDAAWAGKLGAGQAVTFIEGNRLVAVVRSRSYLTAAVAAVPLSVLEWRAASIAWRLVPAGIFAGLAAAVALLLLGRQQISMAAALRQALRRHEFFLLYQPLLDLRTGACIGAEALLRWRRATGELVEPGLFIPVAERTGLIRRITERVLDLVERDAGRHLAEHPSFHVGINLSPSDLRPDIVVRIDGLLARTGCQPSNLVVEITERGFLDLATARVVVADLRARGIAVAIDDFGTGYSSLSYLETLDLDYLKIDRSFIEAIGTGAPTSQVVGHIIAMARTLDLKMIAEGIESAAQANFLRDQGVQTGQGWLFGRPMPFAELAELVQTSRRPASAAA